MQTKNKKHFVEELVKAAATAAGAKQVRYLQT